MTWFKVDDSFYDHPKVFDAPDCAVALWTRAGTWSARNLTDGFVPAGMPARLCDDPDTAVKELVRRGLWTRTSGGYRFHDWATYQPSAEAVKDLRAKRAEAGAAGGKAKAANRKANPPVGNGKVTAAKNRLIDEAPSNDLWITQQPAEMKQNASKPLASASPVAKQNATPTRPVGTGGTGRYLGERSVTRTREEPPPRCPQHIEAPTNEPCGPCGTARRVREMWAKDEAERKRNLPQCPQHRGQPAHSCGPCRAELLGAE